MAMLKTKVKSFFTGLQREKGGQDEEEKVFTIQPTDLPRTRDDPKRTEEIVSEIDGEYFKEGDVDCNQYELNKLDTEINMSALEDRVFQLKMQDNAVYRKIYDLVFANYTAYVQELENVTMLQMSLQEAARTCVNSRRHLKTAKEGVSHGGLGLLAKHRKRERLRALLDILRTLKTLQRTDTRLKELLEDGDYPAATQLCLECQNAIETYKHYTCVSELAISLQDIQNDIERELEDALAKMCIRFNAHRYEQVQEAYRILGKTQAAVDTLLMKFTTTIHDTAYTVVAEYVKMGDAASVDADAQQRKMPYMSLCKEVYISDIPPAVEEVFGNIPRRPQSQELMDAEHFIACLVELCMTLWKTMHNYHQIKLWHDSYEKQPPKFVAGEGEEVNTVELTFNRNYVRQKLEHGLLRIWRDVQQKVRPYVLGVDMAHFKYDDFIHVLGIVSRLIGIGVEFCGEGSDSLQESMRQQSLKYFKSYHQARMDELRIFLETEAWELCPVRSSFTIRKLREFRFMRTLTAPIPSPKATSPSRSYGGSIFLKFASDENPFEEQEEEEEGEDFINTGGMEDAVSDEEKNGDEDVAEELKKDYVDEQTGEVPRHLRSAAPSYQRQRSTSSHKGPLLSNTTLTVIRFLGNYMQMMSVLQPIAFDVLECLSQLFDYYLYAVYDFFTKDLLESVEGIELSAKLTTSLKRIEENLLHQQQELVSLSGLQVTEDRVKVPRASVNPIVDLENPNTLYGLPCRMVAIESLVFLASQFESLLPYLESLIPDAKRSFLTQFFSHTVNTAHELRKPVYYGIATKAIAYDQVLQSMASVKWDIREIMSQHDAYVDLLLQEFIKFKQLQSAIDRSSYVHIPPQPHSMLWEYAIRLANKTFVEGFAQAKKCSNEGRALMQLDFQQYRTKIEKLSSIRPIPNHAYVEDYIKAYYLSETDTEEWLRKHKQEYTVKQLQSLVLSGVGTRVNKKSRQRLLASIEELDKRK